MEFLGLNQTCNKSLSLPTLLIEPRVGSRVDKPTHQKYLSLTPVSLNLQRSVGGAERSQLFRIRPLESPQQTR
jgi:hypothetical protein